MNPIVIMNFPTFDSDIATSVSPVILKGVVEIDSGKTVDPVTWANAEGATSGQVTDTSPAGDWSEWEVSIALVAGLNTIEITAKDSGGDETYIQKILVTKT